MESNTDENEGRPFDLIDGATGQIDQISKETGLQGEGAAGITLPMEQRLEAYEEIIEKKEKEII